MLYHLPFVLIAYVILCPLILLHKFGLFVESRGALLGDDAIYSIGGRASEDAFNLVSELVQTYDGAVDAIVWANRHLGILQGLIPITIHCFLYFIRICFRLDSCISACMGLSCRA